MRVWAVGLSVVLGAVAASAAHAQSEQAAGYSWAEQNGVTDPSSCGGDSPGFVEGCQQWAEEHADAAPLYDYPDPGADGDSEAAPDEGPQDLYEGPDADPDSDPNSDE